MSPAFTLTTLQLLRAVSASPAAPPPSPTDDTSVGSLIIAFLAVVVGLSVFIFLLECGCHFFRQYRDGKSDNELAFESRLKESNVITRGPGQRRSSARRSSCQRTSAVDERSSGNVKI